MTHEAFLPEVWSYANVLRGVGVHHTAYNEQVAQLLFLKIGAERSALKGQLSVMLSSMESTG